MLFEDQKTEELQPFIPSKREDDRSHQPTILLELKRKLIHCSILLHVSLIAFYTITSLIIINAQSQMPSKGQLRLSVTLRECFEAKNLQFFQNYISVTSQNFIPDSTRVHSPENQVQRLTELGMISWVI